MLVEKPPRNYDIKVIPKEPRITTEFVIDFDLATEGHRVLILGDSLVAVRLFNAEWAPLRHAAAYYRLWTVMHRLLTCRTNLVQPMKDWVPFARHIYRELNCEADHLAGLGRQRGGDGVRYRWLHPEDHYLVVMFDGSFQDEIIGAGALLYIAPMTSVLNDKDQELLEWQSIRVACPSGSSSQAETMALALGVAILIRHLRKSSTPLECEAASFEAGLASLLNFIDSIL